MMKTDVREATLSRVKVGDGPWTETRCRMTTVTDIRETPFGPINFGWVDIGPRYRVQIEEDEEMSMIYSNDGWRLTGKTRYQMRGLLWWRKPALQVEESTNASEVCPMTCDTRSMGQQTRWRWMNAADEKNLSGPFAEEKVEVTKPKSKGVCPVCDRGNHAWLTCNHPGCCDGRGLIEKEA